MLQFSAAVSEVIFINLCNVYPRFVANLARIDSQLNKTLKKRANLQFELDDTELCSMNVLKTMLVIPPVLALLELDA